MEGSKWDVHVTCASRRGIDFLRQNISCLSLVWLSVLEILQYTPEKQLADMGKNDKKGGDKAGGKGKGGDKEQGGKSKGAQSINVRHILVRSLLVLCF